jgi:hypothetical protein
MSKRVAQCRFCNRVLSVNSQYLCDKCEKESKEAEKDLDALIESRLATMPPALDLEPRCRAPGIRILSDPRRRRGG